MSHQVVLEASTVAELEAKVVNWLDESLIEAHALSMPDVWHCLDEVLRTMMALRSAASSMGATAEKNHNAKFAKYAGNVCSLLDEAAEGFPVCVDSDFLAALLCLLLSKLRDLDAAAPSLGRGAQSYLQPLFRAARARTAELLEAAEELSLCTARWAPILVHFSEVKAEVMQPLILLSRDAGGGSSSSSKNAAGEEEEEKALLEGRVEAALQRLQALASGPGGAPARAYVAAEQRRGDALCLLDEDLKPFAAFAALVVAEIKERSVELKVR